MLQVVLGRNTVLLELHLSRNAFSGAGIKSLGDGLAGAVCPVQLVKLNAQTKTGSAEGEAALAQAAAANKNLASMNLDWRHLQHRNAAERSMMGNVDAKRRQRQTSAPQ